MRRILLIAGLALAGCAGEPAGLPGPPPGDARPSVLLVTLDTTRADATGIESDAVETPHLEALAARGLYFSRAYTTAPMTLPSHASMMTGLYPYEHGIRENARYLGSDHELLAERLRREGYATAAFVSGLPLSRQFGLGRGFEHYDDDFDSEREARRTTELALAHLRRSAGAPAFYWVHYFDPHEPYAPPEPFRSRYASNPYLGEIAAMDREIGRLVEAFEGHGAGRPVQVLVVGDHGEGLGDHGEQLHGNLLYEGVLRVPLIAAGHGIPAGEKEEPVSVRRVFDTVLAWAGVDRAYDLVDGAAEVVMGEAMKPFLQYGWQPQVMAVHRGVKVIRSGGLEVYDVEADPAESENLAATVTLSAELREAIRAYPFVPATAGPGGAESLSREDEERLASLGYADWQGRTALRHDAPSPKDMTHLFADLDAGSGYFIHQDYELAISVFEDVLEKDPRNLMVAVRLAVAHSLLGRDEEALGYFDRARDIAPDSVDVRHYLGMHFVRAERWAEAGALFESVLAREPNRLPALEALARIRESQGRIAAAAELLERIVAVEKSPAEELAKLGELRMAMGDTPGAILAFEEARAVAPEGFSRDLELGVCYLANRQLEEARVSLDQVSPDDPGYPMALFKRAQVSVLLGEPDRLERIRRARERADATTRPLVENERLFQGAGPR